MRRDNDLITDWIAAQKSDGEYGAYHPKEAGTAGYIPKGSFFLDGIICEDKYNQAKRKVLYIAKECHTWEYDKANAEADDLEPQHFFVRDELNAGHSDNRFLKGLAMLQNAIQNNDYSTPDKSISSLSEAAFINLNKRGGYRRCIWTTLEGYVKRYARFIRRQIEEIDPNIIVCCGEGVRALVKEYHLADRCRDIRCAYHPSCFFVSDREKLRFLGSQNGNCLDKETVEEDQTAGKPIDRRGR